MAEIVAVAALCFWLLLTVDRDRAWPRKLRLPERGRVGDDSVIVIVPARNEAQFLPRTLSSLLEQGVAVVLVDDQSTDGTARTARQTARSAGATDRLQIVRTPSRPEGWSGKVHALSCGLEAVDRRADVDPPWLLFSDADILHSGGSIAALMAQAASPQEPPGYDLVSVMARLRTDGFWEKLLIPSFVCFFHLLYPFRRVSQSSSKVAAAAGGCVLVRRQALRDIGGLAAISGELIDDLALARRMKAVGKRLWLGLDPGIRSLRTYPRLIDIWALVSRTAFTQLRHRFDLLALISLALTLLVGSSPVLFALGMMGLTLDSSLGAQAAQLRLQAIAALAWMLEIGLLLPWVRYLGAPLGYAFALPLAACLYALMTWASAWNHWTGRGARWKGRVYCRAQRRS